MKNKNTDIKNIIFAILAIAGFVLILLSCIKLQARGIPVLVGLIIHTCSMLFLYYNALSHMESDNWDEDDLWTDHEEADPASETEDSPLPSNPYDIPEAEAYDDNEESELIQKTQDQPESEPKNVLTENYFKDVYAEVKESLIDTPIHMQEIVEEIADEISSETILPAPKDGTLAATVIPNALHSFLARPKEIVEIDLISSAKDAMESLQVFADKQNIKLHLSTTCEKLMMKADPDSIRILFRNIIDNSIKYMGRPGHMIITISLLGDDIFLILKDTGNGLSEEETTHVFELNFQGSNRVSGNGLGLTQTKMIVEAFGGTIYAKSSPGNGMAIYIQLPVSGTPSL